MLLSFKIPNGLCEFTHKILDTKMEETYISQETVIVRRAEKKRIPRRELDEYFDQKLQEVQARYRGQTRSYILSRTEFLVWEHFCE